MNKSVIISSFNRLKFFQKSWPTIAWQLTPEDELVVVEDGGEDNWTDFLSTLPVKTQYVFTGNKSYRSCSKAKNIALKLAANPLIIINDPEVWHMTNCIQQIEDIIKVNDEVFIVPGSLYAGRWLNDVPQDEPSIKHSMAPFIAGVLKEKLMAIGGWDERFIYWGNDDNDLMHRLGLSGVQTHCDDEIKVFHQWHTRPPAEAMGDYNEPLLYEKDKSIVANIGRDWGKL